MKHLLSALLVLCLALPAAALADGGAPSSQFGFHGWPYRQSTPCTARPADPSAGSAPAPTAAPTASPAPHDVPSVRPSAAPTASPAVSTGDYTTISLTVQEQKVWNLLNQSRSANGLAALPLDAELCRLARLKCQDMNALGYFAHESPTYGSAADMLRMFGYAFNGVGENIAHHATVEKADAAFMSSPGHRSNILGRQWTRVGVGVGVDKNGFVYVTQLFAR